MVQPTCSRIASLLAAATEILYGLGLGDQIVAISHECDYPPEALNKPRITRALVDSLRSSTAIDEQVRQLASAGAPLYQLDRDALVQLHPELIVTQAQCDVCAVSLDDVIQVVRDEPLLSSTRIVALNPSSLEELMRDIQLVADAAGVTGQAGAFIAALTGRIQQVTEQTNGINASERPRVACIEWTEPLMIAANWTPQLVSLAGGSYGLAEAGRHSTYAEWNALVEYDPEVLVISPCGFDLHRTLKEMAGLRDRAGWSNLAAVKTGRVFALDGNTYLNRCGPRLVDTLEILAHLIHPQRFGVPASIQDSRTAWSAVG